MMNKENSVEKNFNRMAEDGAGDNTPADNVSDSRRRRARNRVVDYADASGAAATDEVMKALVEEMERVMEPIDRAPDNFENIISYGNPPLEKLGKIGTEMIRVEAKFNEQANVMAGAIQKMQNGFEGMDLNKFGEATKRLAKGFMSGAGKATKGIGRGVKNIWDSLSGTNAKRAEDEKLVKQMQDDLPNMLIDMLQLTENMAKAEVATKQVQHEAEKLAFARVEATREINVYLGAAKEVMRRYNEEYIPTAERDFEESQDPDDEMHLKNVIKRAEQFKGRILILESSRLQCINSAHQLKTMMDTMEDQRATIQDILVNGKNEWVAMLAEAGIAGAGLKIAQGIRKAHEFGDRVHEQTLKMIEEAHAMTEAAKGRGTVDPQKLIEAASRMQRLIEKENENNRKRLEQLEETSRNVRGAADKLLETVESANKSRLLEASKEAKEEAERARAEQAQKPTEAAKPAPSNDNTGTVDQPEAASNDTAARRTRRGGPKL